MIYSTKILALLGLIAATSASATLKHKLIQLNARSGTNGTGEPPVGVSPCDCVLATPGQGFPAPG